MTLPPHPRLLLAAADVAAIKARIAGSDWARSCYEDLKARGDGFLGEKVDLPARGGQWYHWYACPKHGTRLRAESPTRHVCPTGGEVYTGYPYDDVYLSTRHDRYAGLVRDLGLLYRISGDRRYADKAREVLLAYAGKYESYPLHDIRGNPNVGGGKVGPQTLDESTWLIPMAQGADCIWDTLRPEEIETLKSRLFYPAAEVIRQHRMGIHNIQCWKNSAVGLVGLLFGDPALVSEAIDDPVRGYQAQMAQGVSPDGPWFEGAWGYHFYTMSALHPLTEAAHHCGIDLYGDAYRRMFLAPIVFAMPDGRLPAFNDSGAASAMGNSLYETALARYNDPRFAIPLQSGSRRNIVALVNGVATLPAIPKEPEPSRNYLASGYAILREGTGTDATWLCLKYGPHGGGHGHPDKNNFVLYGGRVLASDPGTASYGVPIQAGWYRTTLAHNTLIADEASQQAATGACLDFQAQEGSSAVLADAGKAIPGVTYRRAVFLLGKDLLVFADRADAEDGKPRLFDLAFHPSGAWDEDAGRGNAVTAPDKPGYSYLRDLRETTVPARAFRVRSASGPPLAIAFADTGAPTTFWTGTGVGANTEDRVPVLIARRKAASTVYLWAVSLTGQAADIAPVDLPGAARAFAARVRRGHDEYFVVANPDGAMLPGPLGRVRLGVYRSVPPALTAKETR